MRKRVGRGVVVLAAAAAMAGTSMGVAGAVPTTYKTVPFQPQGASIKRLTANFQMTKDIQAPTRAFTAPTSMAADPKNPRVVVAATADLRSRTCYLIVSVNAGLTWHLSKSLPSPSSYPFCTNLNAGVPEVSLAFGRNGVLYYGMEGYDHANPSGTDPGEGQNEGDTSILLARTSDLGKTWQTTIVDNNRGKSGTAAPADQGVTGISVDTSGPKDVVSLGFTVSYSNIAADSPLNDHPVMVSTSTDGGVTFGPPVDLNQFSHVTANLGGTDYGLIFQSSFGRPFLTAHGGTIIAVSGSSTHFNQKPASPPAAGTGLSAGTFYALPQPQLVGVSHDQGKTWTVSTLGPPIYAGTGSMTGLGWTPKGGSNGTFVAVYAATPQDSTTTGIADIVVQRSTDGGKTWSDPLAIDDDNPNLQATSFYPNLSVAPNGRIDAVWQDTRNQADNHVQIQYTYSTDGGISWAHNTQVTDRPLDFNFGISFNSDLRYPPGVASTNQYAVMGWGDTRLATDLTQTQDDFGSVAQFSALPATKNTVLPVIAAIFGGLVIAGLVLLIMLLVRSKKAQGPKPAKKAAKTEVPAGESA